MSEHSQTDRPPSSVDGKAPSTTFDYERYRHHLDRLDLPEAARRHIGEAVWTILRNRVDAAFGGDPVQLARRVGDRFRAAAERDHPAVLGSVDHDNT